MPTVEGLKKLCELEPGFKAGGWVMVLKCNIWHSYKRELEKTNEEMVEIGRGQKNTKEGKHSAPALFSETQMLTYLGSWAVLFCGVL